MSKLLLIEGRPTTASALQAALESEGFSVSVAIEGGTGLAKAKAQDFDAVILNLYWKGCGMGPLAKGFKLVEALYREKPHVPILAFASDVEGDATAEAALRGAYLCVAQRFIDREFQDLLAAIRDATQIHSSKEKSIPSSLSAAVEAIVGTINPHDSPDTRISLTEAACLAGVLARQKQSIVAPLERDIAALRSERESFLRLAARLTLSSIGAVLVAYLVSLQYGWKALPITVLIWWFGRSAQRFFTLAHHDAIELQTLRGDRVEIDFAYARCENAIYSRNRSVIQSACAELNVRPSNPILNSRQTTTELERYKMARESERAWNWPHKWMLFDRKRGL